MKAWATRSLLAAMVGVLALARPGAALGDLALTLARVDFGGLGAEGVALTLDWQDITAPAAVVSARRVSLPGPLGVLEGVTLRCARLRLAARGIRCPAATLAATHAAHGEIDAEISFTYAASGALELTLVTSAIVGGRLEAELQVAEGRTRLTLNGRDLAPRGQHHYDGERTRRRADDACRAGRGYGGAGAFRGLRIQQCAGHAGRRGAQR